MSLKYTSTDTLVVGDLDQLRINDPMSLGVTKVGVASLLNLNKSLVSRAFSTHANMNLHAVPSAGLERKINSLGVPGPQGIQGLQGVKGPSTQGPQGIQGVQGPQGIQGPQGNNAVGSSGPQGVAGIQGVQGATGDQGVKGKNASPLVGLQGLQGYQGLSGGLTKGPDGTKGPNGVNGSQGKDAYATYGQVIKLLNDNKYHFSKERAFICDVLEVNEEIYGINQLNVNYSYGMFDFVDKTIPDEWKNYSVENEYTIPKDSSNRLNTDSRLIMDINYVM